MLSGLSTPIEAHRRGGGLGWSSFIPRWWRPRLSEGDDRASGNRESQDPVVAGEEHVVGGDQYQESSGRKKRSLGEAPSWNFEEGTVIAEGRSILKHLGGGSQYEVYLVWDERLFALVVAKLLRPDRVESERDLRDIRREVEVLHQLSHPILVRCFGAVFDGPHPHFLLEHLEGPTLRRLIKRHGPLPLEQLLPLALHLASALHYLAAEQLVHLDVKPSNIVVGMPPRLIDLSITRTHEDAARLHRSIGTDAYMPPEQCDPAAWPGRIGPAADVWGLGATLYHAVAGKVPFPRPRGARESEDPTLRFPQLVAEPEPLPPEVPPLLRDLIFNMLAKDPLQRPTAAESVTTLGPLVEILPQKLSASRRGGLRARWGQRMN